MIETLGILIPFLIADVLNPVLFAFMVYALPFLIVPILVTTLGERARPIRGPRS